MSARKSTCIPPPGTVAKAEEFGGVNAAEMAPEESATGWVHALGDILPQGRCAFWQTEEAAAAQEAAAAAAEEDGKPPPPPPEGTERTHAHTRTPHAAGHN